MKNPDRRTAHEQRICKHLDRVEAKIKEIQDEPATYENRLTLLQLQFEQQVWFNSWYEKDPEETLEGLVLLHSEKVLREYWNKCYLHVTYLLREFDKYRDLKLDLSTIEGWLQLPQDLQQMEA